MTIYCNLAPVQILPYDGDGVNLMAGQMGPLLCDYNEDLYN